MSDASKAVFLSYASQDADAARSICDALRAAGVEVWFDQSELRGGDAWDQKIRSQIRECALFVPIISANTEARQEGYFRLEWRLADQRTHLMSHDRAFLVPVVIDATSDHKARVPDSFTQVQWTRLPGGETPPAFCERVQTLLVGGAVSLTESSTAERGQVYPPLAAPEATGVDRATPKPGAARRRWVAPVAMVGVAIVALAVWRPWRKSEKPGNAAAALLSEARQLTLKARDLFYHYDATRNDFTLAENMLKRAGELEPGSAEILGASAVLSNYFTDRGYEMDRARLVRSSALADQALRLQPEQAEALLALGLGTSEGAKDFAKAHEYLVRARRGMPGNPKVTIAIALNYLSQLKFAEALRELMEAAQQFPQNPEPPYYAGLVTCWTRRNAEAIEWLERSLAIAPMWRALALRGAVELELTGDGAKALQWLDRVPDNRRQDPRVVFWRVEALRRQRRGADARAMLIRYPEPFFKDSVYFGPKAVLLAQAYELEGRADLAVEAWGTAERLLREKMDSDQDRDSELRCHLFVVLAAQQRGPQAREVADVIERNFAGPRQPNFRDQANRARMAHGYARLGDVASAMRWLRDNFAQEGGLGSLTRASLRTSPDLDPIRDTPEFQALLAEPP